MSENRDMKTNINLIVIMWICIWVLMSGIHFLHAQKDTVSFIYPYVGEVELDGKKVYHYLRFLPGGKFIATYSHVVSLDVWNTMEPTDKSLESGKYKVKDGEIKMSSKHGKLHYQYKGKVQGDNITVLRFSKEKKEIDKITYKLLKPDNVPEKKQGKYVSVVVERVVLDGCNFLLKDEATGDYYEAVNMPDTLKKEGLHLVVLLEEVPVATICMKGKTVKIIEVKEKW